MLEDSKLADVPVILVEGKSISLSEAKSQVPQFLVVRCSVNRKESPAAAVEGVASIDVLTGDLKDKADWTLAGLMGGPNLGI